MNKYGDTTFQTSTEFDIVSKDSPLKQDDTNFNMMFSIIQFNQDGNLVPVDTKGYLELNLVERTGEITSTGFKIIEKPVAVH